MKILDTLSAVFAFRTAPTTILLVLIYAVVFSTVLVTDDLPKLPTKGSSLDLDLQEAYVDLHHIAARPHPFNSHSNDLVRSYILSRLHNLTSRYPFIHVADDLLSNASWSAPGYGTVYFEGTNVLVKIDGSDPVYRDQGGVLFSAHYDSVSTAPGATDDGMGVAVLLHMVKHLAEKRPRRTTVFNINNGEEDGLNGAHAFMEHPWANITDTFLNLEGAAAGGRPILFRATSTSALRSFQSKHVPHPHANVISADAFARGVIRSSTDYSVYTKRPGRGMDGLDFAFYRGRSKYHTKYDSIPGTEGGKRALWAMMESVRGAGGALVNGTSKDEKDNGRAVYFDLFGAALIVFQLRTLLTLNLILAVFGPAIVILLVALQSLVVFNRRRQENGTIQGHRHGASWDTVRQWFTHLGWVGRFWRWAKFWLALLLGVAMQVLLVFGYISLNPFIIYSHPYAVFTSSLALAYVSIVLTLKIPVSRHGPQRPEQQKLTAILQLYVLTWILLLLSTVAAGRLDVGGGYLITAWNVAVFMACVFGCLEVMLGAKGTEGEWEGERDEGRLVRGVRFEVPSAASASDGGEEEGGSALSETGPTEITPLIQRQHAHAHRRSSLRNREEEGAFVWWILQAVTSVPLPVILLVHVAVILLGALPQTLADGSSPITVYGTVALLSIFIVLPLAPFSFKLSRYLTYFVLFLFVVTTVYNWLVFPFSREAPFKVAFHQNVSLNFEDPGLPVTSLMGVKGYLDKRVVPSLPSTWTNDVHCAPILGRGVLSCSWESGLMPDPGRNTSNSVIKDLETTSSSSSKTDWLVVNTTRLGNSSARLSIAGTNTRFCSIHLDNGAISRYHVHGSASERGGGGEIGAGTPVQVGYEVPEDGLTEMKLWSRTWGRTFVVDVEWDAKKRDTADSGLAGRIGCGWVEYESGSVGVGEASAKIPALEEVFAFLPKWTVVAKAEVEAWVRFSV